MNPLVIQFKEGVLADLRKLSWKGNRYVNADPFPRIDVAILELIEMVEDMATAKRPPLAWDIEKQGPPKKPIFIYLAGQPLTDVVAYNVEEQWLIRYKTDKNNKVIADGDGTLVTEKVTGPIIVRYY
jgi:hypothetical protein